MVDCAQLQEASLMFDDSKIVIADEEEMEDFHDYEDEEHAEQHSKLDDYEDEEDDDDEEEIIGALIIETVPAPPGTAETPAPETPPKKPVKKASVSKKA